jgi:hypothetical protein
MLMKEGAATPLEAAAPPDKGQMD